MAGSIGTPPIMHSDHGVQADSDGSFKCRRRQVQRVAVDVVEAGNDIVVGEPQDGRDMRPCRSTHPGPRGQVEERLHLGAGGEPSAAQHRNDSLDVVLSATWRGERQWRHGPGRDVHPSPPLPLWESKPWSSLVRNPIELLTELLAAIVADGLMETGPFVHAVILPDVGSGAAPSAATETRTARFTAVYAKAEDWPWRVSSRTGQCLASQSYLLKG